MVGHGTNDRTRETPSCRVVLLGASNLARGISTVVDTARGMVGDPIDLLIAPGNGRSYGQSSQFFGRRLPGIAQCGLWDALAERPARPTFALVTDVGNDLMYQVDVTTIADWVETCLQRLKATEASVVITQIPLSNLATLSEFRFGLFRRVLFPGCPYDLAMVKQKAQQLSQALTSLANAYGATLVEPSTDWYGWDPIHIKMSVWPLAWQKILISWKKNCLPDLAHRSLRRWIYLRSRVPKQRHVFGRYQARKQPSGALPDGTIVSTY